MKVPTHAEALAGSLTTIQLGTVDDAAKRLALSYAQRLDSDPEALIKIGHLYLASLAALGLTPAARKALADRSSGVGTASNPEDQLQQFRNRRRDKSSGSSGT